MSGCLPTPAIQGVRLWQQGYRRHEEQQAMAYQPLSSLVPDGSDLLGLEVEDLAGVLLVHLNNAADSLDNATFQLGLTSLRRVLGLECPRNGPEYGDRLGEVRRALTEAWAWLRREAFLVQDPDAEGFFLSRRARRLKSTVDFAAYWRGNLLQKGRLHPLIASKVYPAFLRGDYDTAVFQAFREVEVAVLEAGGLGPGDFGGRLMRAAFKPASTRGESGTAGPLTDLQLPIAEQEAMACLFAGAIGLYKSPGSHRHVPECPEEAAEVIMLASQMLRIVDRLKPAHSS
jgi:uncharacterized protein (TIGR02391 family)